MKSWGIIVERIKGPGVMMMISLFVMLLLGCVLY
jgi:hypothetical protein